MLRPMAFYGGMPYFKIALRRAMGKNRIFILLYHRISPQAAPFFEVSISPGVFEKQIHFLKKHFEIIDFKDLKLGNDNRYSPKDLMIITFDDGYRDNYLYAFPILEKHDVPAAFFLVTDYIGTDDLLWHDKLAWILYKAGTIPNRRILIRSDLSQEMIHEIERFFSSKSSMQVSILQSLASILKGFPSEKREDLLRGMAKAFNVRKWPGNKDRPMLSWEEVKEMSRYGISFGSHTKSHPVLTKIPLHLAKEEIIESKEAIEEQIQKPVTTFAYPYGKQEDLSDDIVSFLRNVGFEYACSTESGYEKFPIDNPLLLRRKGISPYPYLFI